MTRQTLLVAVGMAVLVFGLILTRLVLPRGVEPSEIESLEFTLRDLEDRIAHLDDSLSLRVREALGDLPPALLPVGAGSETGAAEAGEEPDEASREASPLERDLQRLFARFDDMERRIRALEEDPVQRGYNFLESESAALRRDGIFALERLAQSDPEARQAIRDMLGDMDPRVRLAALDTLADIEDRESLALVRQMLGDEDPAVRREVVNSIVRLGDRDSAAAVAQLLGDPDDRVREMVADSLGRLKTPETASVLLGALGDPNDRVRGEAIASLGELGAKEAIPQLRQMYEKDPGRHRFRLITALRGLGDSQPYQQEIQRLSQSALSGGDERARVEAIRTLSWFARDQAKEIFEKARQDASGRVRQEAERALRGDGGGGRGRR
ncbi:MAG: HEAT repeat domain-containing protein [Planctomycetes bacterium]|nr:HEAT repeat domain-containing protein [Planctomycetota bacterium]